MVEFHCHNMLMMQALVEALGGQMSMDIAWYLGHAQEVWGRVDAAMEYIHNYHLE